MSIKTSKEDIQEVLSHLSKEELIEMILDMYTFSEEVANLHLAEIGENGLHQKSIFYFFKKLCYNKL